MSAVRAGPGSLATVEALGIVAVLAGTVLLVEIGRRRFGRGAPVTDGGRRTGDRSRGLGHRGAGGVTDRSDTRSAAGEADRHGEPGEGQPTDAGPDGSAAGTDATEAGVGGSGAGRDDERERVTTLLADADGQLPQSTIVDRTHWSKAKVSRLLSKMDEEGDVVKIRLGRENLICLPQSVPEIAADD